MEIRKEVKTYITRIYCSECKQEMSTLPIVIQNNIPIYTYKCPKCGKEETSPIQYPKVDYIEQENSKKIINEKLDDNCIEVIE